MSGGQRVTGDVGFLRRFLNDKKCGEIGAGEAQVSELTKALDDLMQNENMERAIWELRASLCENGWLMGLLAQHKEDALCAEAWKVCVCIYASVRFMTAECAARDTKGTAWHHVGEDYRSQCGTWQYVEDIFGDETFNEMFHYRKFIGGLEEYLSFLFTWLPRNSQHASSYHEAVGKLRFRMRKLPGKEQLVTNFVDFRCRQSAWCYNTAYVRFSEKDTVMV
jgi:hypothetical protein